MFTYIFDAIKKILELKNPWNQEKTIACLALLDQVYTTKIKPTVSFFFKNQPKLDAGQIKKIAQKINEQNDAKIINAYIDLLYTEFIFNGLLQQQAEKQKTTDLDKIQKQIDRLKHLLSDEDLKKSSILYGEIIKNLIKYISFKYEKKPNVNEENVANLPVDYFKNINNDIDYLFTLSKSYENQAIVSAIENISGQFISHANIFIDYIIEEIEENRITSDQAQQKITAFFDAEDIEGSTLSTIKRKAINRIKEKSEQNIAATIPPTTTDIPVQILEPKLEEPKIEIPSEIPVAPEPPAESGTEQKEKKLEQQKMLEREEILKGKQPVLPEPIQKSAKDNDELRKKLAQDLREKVILESNIKFEKPWEQNILENALVETLKTNVSTVGVPFSDVVPFINHIMNIGTAIEKIETKKIKISYDLTPYISALATHPLLDKKSEKSLMNISPEIFKNNKLNFVLFREACATIHDYFKDFPVPEEIPTMVAPQQVLQQKKPQVPAQSEQPAVQKTETPVDNPAIVQPQEAPAVPPAAEPQPTIKPELTQSTDPSKTDVQPTVVSKPTPEKPQEGGILYKFASGIRAIISDFWNKVRWYLSW